MGIVDRLSRRTESAGPSAPMPAHLKVRHVDGDADLLPAVLECMATSSATQVLVTGPGARNVFRDNEQALRKSVISSWTLFAPPNDPSRENIDQVLLSFAQEIGRAPEFPHACFTPADEDQVVQHLFRTEAGGEYSGAIYALGVVEDPLAYLMALSQAVNHPDRSSGELIAVFSLSDRLVTGQFRQRIAQATAEGDDTEYLSYLYLRYVELMRQRRNATGTTLRTLERTLKHEVIPQLFP